MKEYVEADQLFSYIEQSYSDLPFVHVADLAGYDNSRLHKIRNQKHVSLSVADKILTNLDLNHLLSTGDIEIHTKHRSDEVERLKSELEAARRNGRDAMQRARTWRERAKSAEAKLRRLESRSA